MPKYDIEVLDRQVSEAIEVDARIHYDRENLRDWRYLIRFGTEQTKIAFGELDGAFRDTQFSRLDTPYYGIEAHIGLGPLTTRAFSTKPSSSMTSSTASPAAQDTGFPPKVLK